MHLLSVPPLHSPTALLTMSKLSCELGFLARKDLSLILDKKSPRGHDWRGLCDLMGFSYEVNIALNQQESPTLSLLEEWERTLGRCITSLPP